MARAFSSWLSGPPSSEPGTPDQGPNNYPGQRLGLPESGSGSLARTGRRVVAFIIDYAIAMGLGLLTVSFGWLTSQEYEYRWHASPALLVWIVLGAVSVRLFTFTPGQYALGLRVASVDHRQQVGLGRSFCRGLLIAFVVPALFTDTDGRGFQDRLTGTAVVRQ
jgi:uncharacterized RDD family membrane protein YckC